MRCRARAALAAGIKRPSQDLRPATVRYPTSASDGNAASARANGSPTFDQAQERSQRIAPGVHASVVPDEVPGGHSLLTGHPREETLGLGLL